MKEKPVTSNERTPGRDLIEIAAALRARQTSVEETTPLVGAAVAASDWLEGATTLLQGMEADARDSLRECLDANAAGDAAVAGPAALAVVELREDLACLLVALRARPELTDIVLEAGLAKLEEDTTHVIRWLDDQADRVELPVCLPNLLASVQVPEHLVALAWKLPDRWWLAGIILPPSGRILPLLES